MTDNHIDFIVAYTQFHRLSEIDGLNMMRDAQRLSGSGNFPTLFHQLLLEFTRDDTIEYIFLLVFHREHFNELIPLLQYQIELPLDDRDIDVTDSILMTQDIIASVFEKLAVRFPDYTRTLLDRISDGSYFPEWDEYVQGIRDYIQLNKLKIGFSDSASDEHFNEIALLFEGLDEEEWQRIDNYVNFACSGRRRRDLKPTHPSKTLFTDPTLQFICEEYAVGVSPKDSIKFRLINDALDKDFPIPDFIQNEIYMVLDLLENERNLPKDIALMVLEDMYSVGNTKAFREKLFI